MRRERQREEYNLMNAKTKILAIVAITITIAAASYAAYYEYGQVCAMKPNVPCGLLSANDGSGIKACGSMDFEGCVDCIPSTGSPGCRSVGVVPCMQTSYSSWFTDCLGSYPGAYCTWAVCGDIYHCSCVHKVGNVWVSNCSTAIATNGPKQVASWCVSP